MHLTNVEVLTSVSIAILYSPYANLTNRAKNEREICLKLIDFAKNEV